MKRALISMLYLLTFLTTCFSQTATLSKKMATYRNFCLKVREGVELKNVQTLKECIAEWTGDINTIIYQNDTVRITDFDRFSVTDGSNEVGLNKHLLYRPEFIDSLIVYDISFANNYIEKPFYEHPTTVNSYIARWHHIVKVHTHPKVPERENFWL